MSEQSFSAYIARLDSLAEDAKINSSPSSTYDDKQPPWSAVNVLFWVDGLYGMSCKGKDLVGDGLRDVQYTSEWIGVGECLHAESTNPAPLSLPRSLWPSHVPRNTPSHITSDDSPSVPNLSNTVIDRTSINDSMLLSSPMVNQIDLLCLISKRYGSERTREQIVASSIKMMLKVGTRESWFESKEHVDQVEKDGGVMESSRNAAEGAHYRDLDSSGTREQPRRDESPSRRESANWSPVRIQFDPGFDDIASHDAGQVNLDDGDEQSEQTPSSPKGQTQTPIGQIGRQVDNTLSDVDLSFGQSIDSPLADKATRSQSVDPTSRPSRSRNWIPKAPRGQRSRSEALDNPKSTNLFPTAGSSSAGPSKSSAPTSDPGLNPFHVQRPSTEPPKASQQDTQDIPPLPDCMRCQTCIKYDQTCRLSRKAPGSKRGRACEFCRLGKYACDLTSYDGNKLLEVSEAYSAGACQDNNITLPPKLPRPTKKTCDHDQDETGKKKKLDKPRSKQKSNNKRLKAKSGQSKASSSPPSDDHESEDTEEFNLSAIQASDSEYT